MNKYTNILKSKNLIGRGLFSKVYTIDKKEVFILSNDCIKECISFEWTPSCKLFPKIKRLEYKTFSSDNSLYKMKYYPKVKSLKNSLLPFEYEFYRELRKIFNNLNYNLNKKEENFYILKREFSNISPKFKHKKKQLIEALEGFANYGFDICFEISPRNVAVDNGKLILLDCFFVKSQMLEKRKKYTY